MNSLESNTNAIITKHDLSKAVKEVAQLNGKVLKHDKICDSVFSYG